MGTIINVAAIVAGSLVGILLGSKLSERLRQTVVAGMGLYTFAYAVHMFSSTENPLIVLGALLIGGILGEWWQIEAALARLGEWLEVKVTRSPGGEQSRFVRGFMTASLVFCIGPMAILGSIQDGLTGDYATLAIKSVLDGFFALAFASSLGVGVAFSALPILVYQGGITLLAAQVQSIATTEMMNELSATGGVILMAVAVSSLLEIKKIRAGNFLPALIIAPLITALVALF